MSRLSFLIITLFFIYGLLCRTGTGYASWSNRDAPSRIETAYQRGEIDYETALLNRAYLLFAPDKVDAPYLDEPLLPGKCGSPLLREIESNWEWLSLETRLLLRPYILEVRETEKIYDSPGGRFKLHYDISGRDGVPSADSDANGVPDYIELAAGYLDESWSFIVDDLGYRQPPADEGRNGDDRYDVFFEDMFYYGYTSIYSGTDNISCISLENDFQGFPENDDPAGNRLGALKVTIAHEFFHACQYVYDTEESNWFAELSAVWMEETAFDVVNDYYNYLPGFFSHPATGLAVGFPYEKVLWGLFLSQNYGLDIIRDLWTACASIPGDNTFEAHHAVLPGYGTTLDEAFSEFTVWNYLTGFRANDTHSQYEEAGQYPLVTVCADHRNYPLENISVCPLDYLGGGYVVFSDLLTRYPLELTFQGEAGFQWRASAIAIETTDSIPHYTSAQISFETDEKGRMTFAEPGLYSEIIMIPTLHSPQARSVTSSFSAVPLQPLTLNHAPLADSQEVPDGYPVIVSISPLSNLDTSSVRLHYGFGSSVPPDRSDRMVSTDIPDHFQAVIPAQPPGTAIYYYFSASDLEGESVTTPTRAPDSLFHFVLFPDTMPPSVQHDPLPWAVPHQFPLDILATVTDRYGVNAVQLRYKTGSQSDEQAMRMEPVDDTGRVYGAVVPDIFVDGDSLFYRITAVDRSPGSNEMSDPEDGYYVVEIIDPPLHELVYALRAGWNLISLPVYTEDNSGTVLFPDHAGIFAWNGNGTYSLTDSLHVGYGYWVAMIQPDTLRLSGAPAASFNRLVQAGWNMVGGLAYPIETSGFRTNPENIMLDHTVFGYDTEEKSYYPAESLLPGKGYWLASLGEGNLSLTSGWKVKPACAAAGNHPCESLGWIKISEEGRTVLVELGLSPLATAGFDKEIDIPLAPSPPCASLLKASLKVDDPLFTELLRDVRAGENDAAWEVNVAAESNILIEWDVSSFPGDQSMWITIHGETIDMRTRQSVSVHGGGMFPVFMKNESRSAAADGLISIYPNPFNITTTLTYTLPGGKRNMEDGERTTQHTILKIYNVLGQEVNTLVDEVKESGIFTAVWDGRNGRGREMPSGVYYARLEAGLYSGVTKLLLLK